MSLALQTSPLGLPTGALKPRVETCPEFVTSYGPESVELMARAGQVLDGWQQDAITAQLAAREDGQWACFECCEWCTRQNGKGVVLEARALAGFFLLGERLIMWSAHEYKTAMEAFRRVRWLIHNLGVRVADNLYNVDGITVKVNNTNGEESFERLDTGARIKFVARTKGSGRGFSADCNIIDEAFAYTAEQHAALLYTLSARPNPQIIYASSPPLTGITGEVMYDLRLRGDPTAPRRPEDGTWEQDPSLSYRDWGLAGDLEMLDGIDLDDITNWAASNPALGIRITHETVARERRSTRGAPAEFARERLGIWPRRVVGAGGGVIPEELWRELVDDNAARPAAVVRPTDVVLVVQVNSSRSHTTIAAVGARPDGTILASIVDHRPGTHWVVERLAQLKARYGPLCIVAQDKGPTGTLIDDLAEVGIKPPADRERPARGDLVVPWASDIAIGFGLFLDAVTQKRVRHLDEAPVNVALGVAATRPLAGGTAWDYTDPAVGPLLAITQGVWAVLTVKLARRRSAYEDGGLVVV